MVSPAIEKIYQANVRLTPDALVFLEKQEKIGSLVENIIALDQFIITRQDIERLLQEDAKAPLPVEVRRDSGFAPLAKEYGSDLRILDKGDVSGKSSCTGKVEDFVAYFRDRFQRTRRILKTHLSQAPLTELDKLKGFEGQQVRVIAMVREKRITKKGNVLLEVEDENGEGKFLISTRDDKVFQEAKHLLYDEVVAFEGRVSDPFLFVNQIIWPDIPLTKEKKLIEKDLAVAYLSDLHIGSRHFLEKPFKRFLSWLHGEGEETELAAKVKYIIIAGDIVDGIGIYPNQEEELVVADIYKQYELFDAYMQEIPDYIEVIVAPGNHDAVRRAEPQPLIPIDLVKADVKKVGSPSWVEIEGLKHLVYHGTSLDSIISSIPGMSYARPEEPMVELLKRRNLSPIYGENPIVPEGRDYLLIEDEPDVIHMGHIHKNGYKQYRGVTLINSGTFQRQTDYQVKQGHMPSPGIVPIYEMKAGKLSQVDFLADGEAKPLTASLSRFDERTSSIP